jgi:hypothetical protein
MFPVMVPPAKGNAALARSYAVFTAVLEAIEREEAVLTESLTLLCREVGVTAVVASEPPCVRALVARITTPAVVVEA